MKICVFSAFSLLACSSLVCHAQVPAVIARMDQPFLFTYGSWDKKAHIDGGVASLDADGMTPQGEAASTRT